MGLFSYFLSKIVRNFYFLLLFREKRHIFDSLEMEYNKVVFFLKKTGPVIKKLYFFTGPLLFMNIHTLNECLITTISPLLVLPHSPFLEALIAAKQSGNFLTFQPSYA